jgi:CO/xanthine dehydrogenase FAD-binding subunit
VVTPASLEGALAHLARDPSLCPLAGGTDLMVAFEAGLLAPGAYLDLAGLDELRGIRVREDSVTLGALTTYREILRHPVLSAEFPMLGAAARLTGAVAIQNRGTLGGNLVNASPAADSPPALLCYDAEIELRSASGARWRPYDGFHTGYKRMDRAPNELLTRIRLPRRPASAQGQHSYRKVGTRRAQAISKTVFAGWMVIEHSFISELRIAFGSVAPTVLRCRAVEAVCRGQAATPALVVAAREALGREITPIDDIRSTRAYRLTVSGNLLGDFLARAL